MEIVDGLIRFFFFVNGDKPKSEFAENLAIAYNPGICLLALRGGLT